MESRISETSERESYQISPYKASDDEDEEDEDDGIRKNKFVPSWARCVTWSDVFLNKEITNVI